jgi:hypothetical protein
MVTQEDKKNLLLLREQIENCLFEKLSDNKEATKVAKEILNSASLILVTQNVQNCTCLVHSSLDQGEGLARFVSLLLPNPL